MRILLGFLLLVAAVGAIAYQHYDIEYWMTPPQNRASQKWMEEVDKLKAQSKKMQMALMLLSNIEMVTTDQQFKDLIDKSKSPFKKVQNGNYTLKVQIMPWIEDMKYGYLIQHELFENASQNKVTEFNINIDIGFLW